MMLLFNVLILLFSGAHKLLALRASRLERKFARLAKEVQTLGRELLFKEGNSSMRSDPFQAAKRQYLLGALVQKKDRLEALHDKWAQRAERLGYLVTRVRLWKGRLVPYALGALDAVGLGCLVDYLTLGDFVRLRQLIDVVQSWFTT
jgi:hypothetical protein